MTKHISMLIDTTIKMCMSKYKSEIKRIEGIFNLPVNEILRECFRMQNQGKKYITGCDNEDSEGKCAGHEDKEN